MRIVVSIVAVVTGLMLALTGSSLAQAPPAYGPNITLEQALKVVAGAEAEARKNNWPMAIAILDSGGQLVALHRLDNTQFGSIEIARQKAWTAVAFRRPSKAFQDTVAGGGVGLRTLAIEGVVPIEGGLPILIDGKVVGAIGISGGTSDQDGQAAAAGVAALK